MEDTELPVLDTESGITVQNRVRLSTDFASMRTLVESGMPMNEVGRAFKVSPALVKRQAKLEGWMTPAAVGKMRRELARKQAEVYQRTGKAANVTEMKAKIWEERGEELKEKTFEIVRAALEGVSEESAKKLIKNPLGLMHITTVARQITGEEATEAAKGPQIAVNLAFLRSSQPVPVTADAVEV